MTLTIDIAKDEIQDMFRTAWEAQAAALVGYVPQVRWPGDRAELSSPDVYWVRFTLRHTAAAQASLGGIGGRKFEKSGLIFIQIFSPRAKALASLDDLAMIATNAYEGEASSSGVWFRNVRYREGQPDGSWDIGIVDAQFVYDTLK